MVIINKDRCGLLIIDVQEYFRSLAEPILSNLKLVIRCCRKSNVPVIFTRHAHKNPDQDGGMLAKWWKDLIIDGTPDAEILPEIKPKPEEKIVHKKRYSAFFQTDLHSYLQSRHIQQLIVSGVMTNLCCETTARDAFVRDYEVFFLSNATATLNSDFHQATLLNLSFGFARIMNVEEVCQSIYP